MRAIIRMHSWCEKELYCFDVTAMKRIEIENTAYEVRVTRMSYLVITEEKMKEFRELVERTVNEAKDAVVALISGTIKVVKDAGFEEVEFKAETSVVSKVIRKIVEELIKSKVGEEAKNITVDVVAVRSNDP